LEESQLHLGATVQRRAFVSDQRAFGVYHRRLGFVIPGELDLVLTLSYFLPGLRLHDRTLGILELGFSPLQGLGAVSLQLIHDLLTDHSHELVAKLTGLQYSLITFEYNGLFSFDDGACHLAEEIGGFNNRCGF